MSFHFFAFLLGRVAKKTRLHFCGVKWQKLWGILCFRASMIIPRKWQQIESFFSYNHIIAGVCSGILRLTKMGHSKWGFAAHARHVLDRSVRRPEMHLVSISAGCHWLRDLLTGSTPNTSLSHAWQLQTGCPGRPNAAEQLIIKRCYGCWSI